jgi:hypothetical protein
MEPFRPKFTDTIKYKYSRAISAQNSVNYCYLLIVVGHDVNGGLHGIVEVLRRWSGGARLIVLRGGDVGKVGEGLHGLSGVLRDGSVGELLLVVLEEEGLHVVYRAL